jgi:hypothetical protein
LRALSEANKLNEICSLKTEEEGRWKKIEESIQKEIEVLTQRKVS